MPPSPSPSPTFVHTNKRGLELTPPQQANAGKSETDHELLAKEVPNAVKMARYERSLWVDEAAKLAASKHSVKLPEVVANEMIRDEKELGTLKLIGWRNIGRVDETKIGEGCVSLSQLGDGNHRLHFAMKAHFIEFQPSRPHRARLTLPPSPRKTGRGGFAQVPESAYQVEFEPSCLQAVLCCKGRASSQSWSTSTAPSARARRSTRCSRSRATSSASTPPSRTRPRRSAS